MDEETLTVWLDTALLMLGGFVLMTVLMMTAMNPPAAGKVKEDNPLPPGSLIIEAHWQDGIDADVDLWVKAPGDMPVGYSNKNGQVFNLLRDDLGRANDLTLTNYEVAYTRGLPPGEYVINLHMYRGIDVAYPVLVKVSVRLVKDTEQGVIQAESQLVKQGQETTALRFRIDEAGGFVPGSFNSIYKPLRVPS